MGEFHHRIVELFRTATHPHGWQALPDYTLRGKYLYRVEPSPQSPDEAPDAPEYQQKGVPRRFFRLPAHPDGDSTFPDYELRGTNKLYRTMTHPDGWSGLPDYEVW